MYHPSAVVLAQVLADFPILVVQVSMFLLPIYFMANLRQSASAFFTLWYVFCCIPLPSRESSIHFSICRIIIYVTTLALTAFFRMVGFSFSTFEGASGVSGIAIGLLILYTVCLDLACYSAEARVFIIVSLFCRRVI